MGIISIRQQEDTILVHNIDVNRYKYSFFFFWKKNGKQISIYLHFQKSIYMVIELDACRY